MLNFYSLEIGFGLNTQYEMLADRIIDYFANIETKLVFNDMNENCPMMIINFYDVSPDVITLLVVLLLDMDNQQIKWELKKL